MSTMSQGRKPTNKCSSSFQSHGSETNLMTHKKLWHLLPENKDAVNRVLLLNFLQKIQDIH